MVKPPQVKSSTVLEDGKISDQEVEEVVSLALKVLKDMMLDTEASIETRFSIALRLFEMFGRENKPSSHKMALEEGIIRTLEKNAHDIERNAHHLTHIEALLQLANQPPKNHEPVYQNRKNSHKGPTIIDHP
jgi:hypothetical protein